LFGVLLVHASARVEVVGFVTVRDPGALGAVAMVTVAVMVLVPFAFVAVRVYVVVEVGFTLVDPTRVEVEKLPGVIASEVALPTFQESVDVPAEATIVGEAVKEVMVGVLFPALNAIIPTVILVPPTSVIVAAVDPAVAWISSSVSKPSI
jgi:hypothetical protein